MFPHPVDTLCTREWSCQAHCSGRNSKPLQVWLQYFACFCIAHTLRPLFITPGDDPGVVGQRARSTIDQLIARFIKHGRPQGTYAHCLTTQYSTCKHAVQSVTPSCIHKSSQKWYNLSMHVLH